MYMVRKLYVQLKYNPGVSQKSKLEGVSILLITIFVGIFWCELGYELRCECEYFITTPVKPVLEAAALLRLLNEGGLY